jgi:hypothetical protein
MDELAGFCARIQLLLERRQVVADDDVEVALTDGYAHALALERERRRADERIRQLAGSPDGAGEILALKGRLGSIERDLSRLRGLLRGLAATLEPARPT